MYNICDLYQEFTFLIAVSTVKFWFILDVSRNWKRKLHNMLWLLGALETALVCEQRRVQNLYFSLPVVFPRHELHQQCNQFGKILILLSKEFMFLDSRNDQIQEME